MARFTGTTDEPVLSDRALVSPLWRSFAFDSGTLQHALGLSDLGRLDHHPVENEDTAVSVVAGV